MSLARYIAVEGVIGVGKTTLVRALGERLAARMIFEEFEENPFLADFYRDSKGFAFSTQLFFLMSRYRQQQEITQTDLFRPTTIADYFFDKDRIFAVLTLERDELALYESLFGVLALDVPKPDLVVYLHADLDLVMRRIQERGRSYEQNMDPEYLAGLSGAYADYFQSYKACPVLSIDTSGLDLRNDARALDRILDSVLSLRGGRVARSATEPMLIMST